MNKAKLKTYAPQARRDFIAAVMARANLLGISEKNGKLEIAPSEKKGDVALIAGQAWPAKVHEQRERLIKRMQKIGFGETAEAIAYTWFNRFAALRYMEIHDYLGHGHRVLSSREGGLPEILTHATELVGVLPGLNASRVADMKLAGNKDGELYRLLLVAQCNALSSAMPFLFEHIDDETELLLPDNLLRTDSIITKLVEGVSEEDWAEVEIIGWLYQFYISEKKDQVIGKVVKSEDIPAATQLFTPNWIVQYLVQNSVGRLWLMANPQSTLAKEWPYYITPAEQTPEVQAQLDALIQTRVREDGDTLNPESITVLDPACGSGHILVVAYDVLKVIYLERGYQPRAIPRLILEKNLYGLDIDDRAAQMAGFALLMKARADDRRLFTPTVEAGNLQPPKLNVLSLQESKGLSVDELATHLTPFKVQRATITAMVVTFEHAKTFGSLIQIPNALQTHLAALAEVLPLVNQSGDIYASAAADDLLPLVQQAQVLAMQFDAVVANPPYMGSKGMTPELKEFAKSKYPNTKSDVFSMFIERCTLLALPTASLCYVTPYVWMFISTYEPLRTKIVNFATLNSLIQLEYNAFEPACVPVCAFVIHATHIPNYEACFVQLSDFKGHENQAPRTLEAISNRHCGWFYTARPDEFKAISGSTIAYWVGKAALSCYQHPRLSNVATVQEGLKTGENARFIRKWYEVNYAETNLIQGCEPKWFGHTKGGGFRRWYGNCEDLLLYSNGGEELHRFPKASLTGKDNYFKENISWGRITSGRISFRYTPVGLIPNMAGLALYPKSASINLLIGYLNSTCCDLFLSLTNPTINFPPGTIAQLPLVANVDGRGLAMEAIAITKEDWNVYERSWEFQSSPLLKVSTDLSRILESNYTGWINRNRSTILEMKRIEEENNRIFIDAYGLADELTPDVLLEHITLTVNPTYRYGANLSEKELWNRFRQDTMAELISYAIGCMMGRYSLDEPGLIYAHGGNIGFDATRYKTFSADADGIIPITDELWFADDAPSRIREFLNAVWGPDTLEENMAWLAESLGTKASETPDETIRRYIADKFYKDHLQTYKKRPIYWLFSSGKQGAFQALVYLHRYHEGTLSRLRAEYVVPLTGKMQSRIEMLEKDKDAATSTAARTKIAKQIEALKKKHVELLAYDEKLRHYADMRISLDLDDGVKVNYGKFGDLLAEVKAITGGSVDD